VADGQLLRVGRGLYSLPEREVHEHEALIQVAKRVSRGIVCLLSALSVHGLSTQNPPDVWLALPRTARSPQLHWPPLKLVWWSGAALTSGIIERELDGTRVRLTSPARTVADCFKHRRLVGIDVAVEALKDYRRQRAGSIDELLEAATVSRVSRVISPYLEAIL
jgi:predicted transcriptional regulator of viral defense system